MFPSSLKVSGKELSSNYFHLFSSSFSLWLCKCSRIFLISSRYFSSAYKFFTLHHHRIVSPPFRNYTHNFIPEGSFFCFDWKGDEFRFYYFIRSSGKVICLSWWKINEMKWIFALLHLIEYYTYSVGTEWSDKNFVIVTVLFNWKSEQIFPINCQLPTK